MSEFDEALHWTSTTASAFDLEEAWNAQQRVIHTFTAHGWLTSRTEGWLRETHVTHGANGWHVHSHWVIFSKSKNDLEGLSVALTDRWLESAQRVGVTASRVGQHSSLWGDPRGAVRYASKGNATGCHSASGNRGLLELWQAYADGDAEAGAAMVELQAFFSDGQRRRWKASGGLLRGTATHGQAHTPEAAPEPASDPLEALLDPSNTRGWPASSGLPDKRERNLDSRSGRDREHLRRRFGEIELTRALPATPPPRPISFEPVPPRAPSDPRLFALIEP